MDITWYGHACFRLSDRGAAIVTDPFADDLGYSRPRIRADAITISHEHPGHNNRIGFRGGPRVFDGPGEYEVRGVFITGIAAYHDAREGADWGRNTIFLYELDGVTVCHLGDLGHIPDQQQAESLSDVDVLLCPVGGMRSLDAARAAEVISLIEPRLVVPMHYRAMLAVPELRGVDKFLNEMGMQTAAPETELRITKSSLPEETQIVLLQPGP